MNGPRLLSILLLGATLPAFARSSAPSTPPAKTAPAAANNSRQMTLDVVVTAKDGDLVPGLNRQDFSILDNKHPDSITAFAVHPPVSAVIVLDTVNTSFQTLSTERDQLEKFFLQNGGHLPLPVTLEIFSYSGLNVQEGASTNGRAELDFLNRNPIAVHQNNQAQGLPGAFDRINRSIAALQSMALSNLKVRGAKLLIWVSPGWPIPQESALGLSEKEKTGIFDRIVTVSGLLMVSRTTLYSVDPLGTEDAGGFRISRYHYYLNEIKSPTQPQVGNLALQVFATHSGGRVFVGSNDISGELNDCLRDGSAFYSLSFDPPHAAHANEYHHLKIKLDKPELKARARSRYYLQP
ncbi:MAG: VWA domain-containing protein [Acidobacteriaceae bacterium]